MFINLELADMFGITVSLAYDYYFSVFLYQRERFRA